MLRGITIALVLLAGCENKLNGKGKPAPAPVADPIVPAAPPIEVTGREFFEAYVKNAAEADAAYFNKSLRVHCIVGSSHGRTYLEIEAAAGTSHIAAWFTDDGASALRQLKHYDEVFLRCRGGGMLDVPTLKDCVLERVVK